MAIVVSFMFWIFALLSLVIADVAAHAETSSGTTWAFEIIALIWALLGMAVAGLAASKAKLGPIFVGLGVAISLNLIAVLLVVANQVVLTGGF